MKPINWRWVFHNGLIAVGIAALFVVFVLAALQSRTVEPAGGPGTIVQFDGRTIEIAPGQTFAIQSMQETRVFTDVTVTTSQVTLTVWGKPGE